MLLDLTPEEIQHIVELVETEAQELIENEDTDEEELTRAFIYTDIIKKIEQQVDERLRELGIDPDKREDEDP